MPKVKTRNMASNAPNIFMRCLNEGIISNSVDERTTMETRLPTIPKRPRKAVQIPSIKNLIIDNIVSAKREKDTMT